MRSSIASIWTIRCYCAIGNCFGRRALTALRRFKSWSACASTFESGFDSHPWFFEGDVAFDHATADYSHRCHSYDDRRQTTKLSAWHLWGWSASNCCHLHLLGLAHHREYSSLCSASPKSVPEAHSQNYNSHFVNHYFHMIAGHLVYQRLGYGVSKNLCQVHGIIGWPCRNYA